MTVPYVSNELVVSADLDEELVYKITQVLVEHHEEFHGLFAGADEITPAIMLKNAAVEVHPGAARYYDEAGIAAE